MNKKKTVKNISRAMKISVVSAVRNSCSTFPFKKKSERKMNRIVYRKKRIYHFKNFDKFILLKHLHNHWNCPCSSAKTVFLKILIQNDYVDTIYKSISQIKPSFVPYVTQEYGLKRSVFFLLIRCYRYMQLTTC